MWGTLTAYARTRGKIIHAVDGLIAATAIVHNLDIITRNVRDFPETGVTVVDPWLEAGDTP